MAFFFLFFLNGISIGGGHNPIDIIIANLSEGYDFRRKIEFTYTAVVEFIKWYNTNQKNNQLKAQTAKELECEAMTKTKEPNDLQITIRVSGSGSVSEVVQALKELAESIENDPDLVTDFGASEYEDHILIAEIDEGNNNFD